MEELIWALLATFIVSLISLIGIITLIFSKKILNKLLFLLVGLSAGALMGGAFLHIIPESVEYGESIFIYVLLGFILFFILERVIRWHHCHKLEKCEVHPFTYMILIGGGLHNLIDGILIATSFVVNFNLGLVTTLAVILHEIPQELGDFGVLVYGGFSKFKALLLNFVSATLAMLGAVIGFFLSSMYGIEEIILPITAGGFIYIAASDLIPELHKEKNIKKSLLAFTCFIIGILLMFLLELVHIH